jgi:quinol monooxygenase YgiN
MLLILGSFRLPIGKLELAHPHLQRMIKASRDEDGCVAYSYAQDLLDPTLIRVHEVWRDKAALDRHFATAHIAIWRAAWPGLQITERNLTLHTFAVGEPT